MGQKIKWGQITISQCDVMSPISPVSEIVL